jgi:hypothetical protein
MNRIKCEGNSIGEMKVSRSTAPFQRNRPIGNSGIGETLNENGDAVCCSEEPTASKQ